MKYALLAVLLSAVVSAQQPVPTPVAADPIKALQDLTRKSDSKQKLAALSAAALLKDDAVVQHARKLATDEDGSVRQLAVKVLRFSPADGAEAALLELTRDRVATKEPDDEAGIMLALGQRGHKPVVKALVDGIADMRPAAFVARVQALAHVRSRESVDALLGLTALGLGGHRRNPELDHTTKAISAALTNLTGEKHTEPADWRKWWKSQPASWEPDAAPRFSDDKQAKQWEKLWANPFEQTARKEKRAKGDKAGGRDKAGGAG